MLALLVAVAFFAAMLTLVLRSNAGDQASSAPPGTTRNVAAPAAADLCTGFVGLWKAADQGLTLAVRYNPADGCNAILTWDPTPGNPGPGDVTVKFGNVAIGGISGPVTTGNDVVAKGAIVKLVMGTVGDPNAVVMSVTDVMDNSLLDPVQFAPASTDPMGGVTVVQPPNQVA